MVNKVRCAVTFEYIPIADAMMCQVGRFKNMYVKFQYITFREVDGQIGICTFFDNYKNKS
jgi:hypothetical protein